MSSKVKKKNPNIFRKVITTEDEKQKLKFAMLQVNKGDAGDVEMEMMTDEPSKPEKSSKKGKKRGNKSHKGKKKLEENYEEEEEKVKPIQESVQVDINIGNIKEIEKIGQGYYASVEKAILVPSNIIIALKKIPTSSDISVQKQISQELKIMKEINCEYIVTLYGEYINQGYICLALEYMDKGTLSNILKIAQTIPENILNIMVKQILNGMNYLHSKKLIIHRDIKPSNILLNSEGNIKISDFGVSGECTNSIDMKNSFIGTVKYMSPERIKGANYSFDSDIWSLGVLMLECAVGYFPIPPREKKSNQDTANFWELTTFYYQNHLDPFEAPGYSFGFNQFINKCLQLDSSKRGKAAELLEEPLLKSVDEFKGKEEVKMWLNHILNNHPDIKK